MDTIVVIGAGLAGGTAVTELREAGYDGQIVLFGSEPHAPYERPPLSKGYLLGDEPLEKLFVHEAGWYGDHEIQLRTGTEVTGLDLGAHRVHTAEGAQPFDGLLLATGAEPRRLGLADETGRSAYLRTIEDSDRIKAAFGAGRRMEIIGAGWIGLEVAAAARLRDTAVTVFESAELPLLRVLGPEVASIFAALHRHHGVDLRLGVKVGPADLADTELVVVGIGAEPSIGLAEQAELDVDNGVLVDAHLQTSRPGVYAVGDIANQWHPVLQRRVRVEHWDNAIEQAKVAAHNLLGAEQEYSRLPYFFTDQYDLGMEYFGLAGPDATVTLQGETEDVTALKFRAYWVENGVVTAAMQANDWDASDEVRDQVGKPLPA